MGGNSGFGGSIEKDERVWRGRTRVKIGEMGRKFGGGRERKRGMRRGRARRSGEWGGECTVADGGRPWETP
jgi:hypothetical protein